MMAKNKDMTQSPRWLKQQLECRNQQRDRLTEALKKIRIECRKSGTHAQDRLFGIDRIAQDALDIPDEWESR